MAGDAIGAALSGLRVAQLSLDTIASNISNVSTEGYTRKILPQSTSIVEGLAVGVQAETVVRSVNETLILDIQEQSSVTSNLSVKDRFLEQIELFHGAPEAERAISHEISRLRDTFISAAETPEDPTVLREVVNQAILTAERINDLSDLYTTLRNDAQDEIVESIDLINGHLEQIAALNGDIRSAINLGQSTATLEDLRDQQIKSLRKEMEITTFKQGDGIIVVQTPIGTELASEVASPVAYAPLNITPDVFYDSDPSVSLLNGITVNGVTDITEQNLGGRLGALIELRDEIIPEFTAQLDEVAHKMAFRMNTQGLALFVNDNNQVPDDVVADYVRFAEEIKVNQSIISDPTLIRSGTNGNSVQTGSPEVIRKILDFAYGANIHEAAQGAQSLDVPPLSDISATATAIFTGYRDITSLPTVEGGASPIVDGVTDTFIIDVGGTDATVNIPAGADDTALLATIDAALVTAGVDGFTTAQFNADGELEITSTAALQIEDGLANGIGADGLDFLGLHTVSVATELQVADFIDQLNSISGVNVSPQARMQGIVNISGFTTLDGANSPITSGSADTFIVDVGGTDVSITVTENATAADLVTLMNDGFGAANVDATASLNTNGQLVITSSEDLTIENGATNGMGTAGIERLGLNTTPVTATEASFDIQVGLNAPVTVTLEVGDTRADFLAKIEAVPGVTATIDGDGFLVFNPDEGGDMQVTDGIEGLFSALMGSSGGIVNVAHAAFRSSSLGPNGDLTIDVTSSFGFDDFAERIVSNQSVTRNSITNALEDEQTYLETLERLFLDQSGVNLDQELSDLIRIQTAYSASARTINAVQELFDELLDILR